MAETESSERVIQRDGERWSIREITTRTPTGAPGARCLICESDEIVRRVWQYPGDWEHLSDDALLAICSKSLRH